MGIEYVNPTINNKEKINIYYFAYNDKLNSYSIVHKEPFFEYIILPNKLFLGETHNICWNPKGAFYSQYLNIDLSGSNTILNVAIMFL